MIDTVAAGWGYIHFQCGRGRRDEGGQEGGATVQGGKRCRILSVNKRLCVDEQLNGNSPKRTHADALGWRAACSLVGRHIEAVATGGLDVSRDAPLLERVINNLLAPTPSTPPPTAHWLAVGWFCHQCVITASARHPLQAPSLPP